MVFLAAPCAPLRIFSVVVFSLALSGCVSPPSSLGVSLGLSKPETLQAPPSFAPYKPTSQAFAETPAAVGSCAWRSVAVGGLTFSAAIERALCAHPKIRDARAALKEEGSQRFAVMGSLLPSVSAAATRAQNETVAASFFGTASSSISKGTARSITVGWLLYDFGGRSAQIEAATETVIAAVAGQDITLQNAFASAAENYFAVVTNKALGEVAQAAIVNAQRMVAAAKSREKLGAATPADRQYAQVGLAQAELFASRVNEQLQLSKGDLATALNLDPDTPIALASASADRELASEYFTSRTSQRIGELIKNVEAHPQIRAATARANASNAQIKIASSEHMPKLSMVGNYFVNGRPGSSVTSSPSTEKFVGLSLAIPMFDGFATYNRANASQARHERNLAQLEDMRGQVKSAIWKAHQSSLMSVKSLKAAEAVVTSASAAKNQAQTRYQNGAGDIMEWLRVEKTYFDARIDVIKAQADIRTARLRLVVALGHLGSWTFEQSPQDERIDMLVRKRSTKS